MRLHDTGIPARRGILSQRDRAGRARARNGALAPRVRGWTQIELAQHAGIPPGQPSKIENARLIEPSLAVMVSLAQALGFGVDALLTGDRSGNETDGVEAEARTEGAEWPPEAGGVIDPSGT